MKGLNVTVVVVRVAYADQYGLMRDPNFAILKTYPDFAIFRFHG
jgi:hypothetical protein